LDQQVVQANDASRQRLRALVTGLDDDKLQLTVRDGWTVATLLAHVAFWDQSTAVRWDGYARDGDLVGISDAVIDVVNEANRPMWYALSGRSAAELALRAAEEIDSQIEALPAAAVNHARELGRRYMLDRSLHRNEHLDELEQFLRS
jgi:hypothetical protein